MTEEIAKTASQLLKEKSELTDDLSKICDEPKEDWMDGHYYLSLNYGYSHGFMWSCGTPSLNISSDKEVKEKVRKLLISEINNKIKDIDNKLEKLTCN